MHDKHGMTQFSGMSDHVKPSGGMQQVHIYDQFQCKIAWHDELYWQQMVAICAFDMELFVSHPLIELIMMIIHAWQPPAKCPRQHKKIYSRAALQARWT